MTPDQLRNLWAKPQPDFSPVPFWFWNAELAPDEIRRQLRDFREHGVWSVIPHARIPLPESTGWLTDRWFECFAACLDEARSTGMQVWIYDEGMYPSGSAGGRVVACRPDLRARVLVRVRVEDADARRLPDWAVTDGCAWESELHRDAQWGYVVLSSGSRIRGLGYGVDPLYPDLLNPESTREFIRIACEPYWERFAADFGSVIPALFTDEPSPLGRLNSIHYRPWNSEIGPQLQSRFGATLEDVLPLLWEDPATGPGTDWAHRAFQHVVDSLFADAYYRPLSAWCEARGIALSGHPAGMSELSHLRWFQLPAQDVVWRQVTPESSSAGGPDSVLGKVSSSAAHLAGRRRNANEAFGAYGWELSAPEMKWLTDWLLVRGVNLLIPHAFYYSLEGEAKHERPPDVGPGNQWWPAYRSFADYVSRISGLFSQGRHVAGIAVYDHGNQTEPDAGRALLEIQRDFDYLERSILEDPEGVSIEGGQLWTEHTAYRVLVVPRGHHLPIASLRRIQEFAEGGGIVIALGHRPIGCLEPERLAEADEIVQSIWPNGSEFVTPFGGHQLAALLFRLVPGDPHCAPPTPALRVIHHATHIGEAYLFVNESVERTIDCEITPRGAGIPEVWDAESGGFRRIWHYVRDGTAITLPLRLSPSESRVIVVTRQPDPLRIQETNLDEISHAERTTAGVRVTGWASRNGVASALGVERFEAFRGAASVEGVPEPVVLAGPWECRADGRSWTTPGLEPADIPGFAGVIEYVTHFDLGSAAEEPALEWRLELDGVSEFAAIGLNETPQDSAARLWPPFRWSVSPVPGVNQLTIRVWNSLANRYDGANRPSGLTGPVRLTARRRVSFDLLPSEPLEFPVSVVG